MSRLSLHFDALPAKADVWLASCLATRTLQSATADFLCTTSVSGEHAFPLMRNYAVAEAGRLFRFQLLEGLRFHDGSEITARNVLSSLESRMAARRAIEGAAFDRRNPIRSVRRTTKSKFEIQCDPAAGDLPSFLSDLAVPVYKTDTNDESVIGGGLYRIASWTPGRIDLELNASHGDASPGLFPLVSLIGIQESDTLATLLARRTTCVASRMLTFWCSHDVDPSRVLRFQAPTGLVLVLALARHASPHVQRLREALAHLPGDKFVTFQSRWLEPLSGFFPEGHVLAVTVDASTLAQAHPASASAHSHQEPLVIAVEDGLVPPAVLQEWQWFLSQMGTSVAFKSCQKGAWQSLLADGRVDGVLSGSDLAGGSLFGQVENFFEPLLTHCSSHPGELAGLLRQARSLVGDKGRGPQALRAFLRAVMLKACLLPACFVPEVILVAEGVKATGRGAPSSGIDVRYLRPADVGVDEESLRRTKLEAITATTQMFAHDVRKPFSLLRMAMDLMLRAENLGEARNITERLLPEVDKAIESVNGMIEDLMEVGGTRPLRVEPTDARVLIRSSLLEVFAAGRRSEAEGDIAFTFDLPSERLLLVDASRLQRAFSNILTNAVQAMAGRGRIWISARDAPQGNTASFVIGNTHSAIDSEEIPRVFEAFYTRGKRGGTGLGLAIVEKIVREHGGTIACLSTPELGAEPPRVEFHFTLPLAPEGTKITAAQHKELPRTASELVAQLGTQGPRAQDSLAALEQEARKLEDAIARNLAHCEPFMLLVVDDEDFYRDALGLLVARSEKLRDVVRVEGLRGEAELRARLAQDDFVPWDLILCDIDLGPDSLDGFALVRLLRERGLQSDVCVHSNQTGLENYRRALEEGADVFLPKPMSRLHFLKLLQETARKRMGSNSRRGVRQGEEQDARKSQQEGNQSGSANGSAGSARSIAVVDDNFIVLHAWKKHLPAGRVQAFSSPREFWSAVGDGLLVPDELLCVVTDHAFGDTAQEDGLSFLGMLEERYRMPVFLQTHHEFDAPTRARLGIRLLAKRPHSVGELEALALAWHK